MALLVDPNFPSAETQPREMQEAVRSLRLNLLVLKAGTTDEINTAFGTLVRERTGILSRFPTVSPECSRISSALTCFDASSTRQPVPDRLRGVCIKVNTSL
jgi:hypothetical protein